MMGLALLASLRGYQNKKYVLFIPLLALSLGVELARHFFARSHPSIVPPLSLFVAVEYTLLSLIIANFIESPTKKMIVRISIFIIVPVILILKLSTLRNLNLKYIDMVIASPFLCVWTILYLFETTQQDEEILITKNPMLWISLGNLLFFSGSFFSYGFGSYLEAAQKTEAADAIYNIARVLNILFYILYFTGFLCLKKK